MKRIRMNNVIYLLGFLVSFCDGQKYENFWRRESSSKIKYGKDETNIVSLGLIKTLFLDLPIKDETLTK